MEDKAELKQEVPSSASGGEDIAKSPTENALSADGGEKGDLATRLAPYFLGVFLALAVLFLVRWGFLCPGYEYEPDCFFHARIVEDGPSVFFARQFPWLTHSTWTEHFSDKELLFHLFLWGVTRIGKLLGATNEYPFHYQVMCLDALLLAAFAVLLFRNRVKHPWLYLVLLVTTFPSMTYRLVSLRAYLMSMTLAVVLLTAFLEPGFRRWRWRPWFLLGMGFLASWTYSSPHLLLVVILPFAVAEYLDERRFKCLWVAPALFLAGIALGLTIHPQFPNTFLTFKVQCIDVVLAFFLNLEKIPLQGGKEFYANTWTFAAMHYYTYPALTALIVLLLYKYRRFFFDGKWIHNVQFNGLVFTTVFCTVLCYVIYRFNEYALFPQCALLAILVSRVPAGAGGEQSSEGSEDTSAKAEADGGGAEGPKDGGTEAKGEPWPYIASVVLTLASTVALFWYTMHLQSQGQGELPAWGVAQWAEENHIPEGTVIANAVWSSFPALYYAMPKYRFCWGIEPAFSWHHSPQLVRLAKDIENGVPHTPQEFRETYGSDYLYVHLLEWQWAEYFWKSGFIPIYENWDGWIFDLTRHARVVTPLTEPLLYLKLVKKGNGAPYVLQYCIEKTKESQQHQP